MISERPKINRKWQEPVTLGDFREIAIDILKNHTDIPDRATIFINRAGVLNLNWKTTEDMEADLADKEAQLLKQRQDEVVELESRLEQLKELGI